MDKINEELSNKTDKLIEEINKMKKTPMYRRVPQLKNLLDSFTEIMNKIKRDGVP